jgi:endoglucanase
MSAVTGLEDAMADTLVTMLPGAHKDRAGNVVWARGSGDPVRLAACAMDEVGYVVGSVTAEGYLTLRRVGTAPVGPLFDQFLEGQRVTVFGRRGPVQGVVGVRSTHLTRGRPQADEPPFPLDNAYVDVGASTAQEVAASGIQVLSPVTRTKKVERYGTADGLAAAPWMAERAACAALVSAALKAAPGTGTTVVAFTARRHFANDGLQFLRVSFPGAEVADLGDAAWQLPVKYAHTPVETVAMSDVASLEQRLVAWLGGAR